MDGFTIGKNRSTDVIFYVDVDLEWAFFSFFLTQIDALIAISPNHMFVV